MAVLNIMGFIAAQNLSSISRQEYLKEHADSPPIVIELRGPGGKTKGHKFNTRSVGGPKSPVGPYDIMGMKVHEVYAADENGTPFPMITVGCVITSHIHLNNGAVSKYHASFRRDFQTKAMMIHDETSTNGTALVHYSDKTDYVEDRVKDVVIPIEQGGKVTLEDGVVIEFGGLELGTRLLYLESASCKYDYLMHKSGLDRYATDKEDISKKKN